MKVLSLDVARLTEEATPVRGSVDAFVRPTAEAPGASDKIPPAPLRETSSTGDVDRMAKSIGDLPYGGFIESSPTTPQPEEEADGPLPRKSVEENGMLPRKSKLLSDDDAITDHVAIEGRNSIISDAEPAREPQPLGQSPRDPIEELSSSTDTPMLESPGGATSSSFARPSASGPE